MTGTILQLLLGLLSSPLDGSLLQEVTSLCQPDLGDTYLSSQLNKEPSESIVNVLLIGVNLEGERQKQEIVKEEIDSKGPSPSHGYRPPFPAFLSLRPEFLG